MHYLIIIHAVEKLKSLNVCNAPKNEVVAYYYFQ